MSVPQTQKPKKRVARPKTPNKKKKTFFSGQTDLVLENLTQTF
jgi:hypothetical protein